MTLSMEMFSQWKRRRQTELIHFSTCFWRQKIQGGLLENRADGERGPDCAINKSWQWGHLLSSWLNFFMHKMHGLYQMISKLSMLQRKMLRLLFMETFILPDTDAVLNPRAKEMWNWEKWHITVCPSLITCHTPHGEVLSSNSFFF